VICTLRCLCLQLTGAPSLKVLRVQPKNNKVIILKHKLQLAGTPAACHTGTFAESSPPVLAHALVDLWLIGSSAVLVFSLIHNNCNQQDKQSSHTYQFQCTAQ
jgi:hypothetical protein